MRHFIWNVDPAIFILGPIEIRWYGLFFALGFLLGFQIMAQFYRQEHRDLENLSELCLYLMLGTIIGARLGHVLLYQPDYFLSHPWEIPMIWQGGLASHGGFAGVMISLYLYLKKHRDMSFIELADRLAIPCLLAAALIRIGNFFNSEILGILKPAMGRRLRPRGQYSPTSGDALRGGRVLCRFLRALRRLLEDRDHSISRQSLRHDLNDLLSRPFPDRVRQRKSGAIREPHAIEHGATDEHSLHPGWVCISSMRHEKRRKQMVNEIPPGS